MTDAATANTQSTTFSWSLASLRASPMRYAGVTAVVFIRYFMGLFFFAAGINKLRNGWAWTDYLKGVFEARVNDLTALAEPTAIEAFGLMYLKVFAIPLHLPIGAIVTLGELGAGLGFFLGLCTRWSGAMAFFLMFNFAIGGYYDASLILLCGLALVLVVTPSGHWLGLDRRYALRYPSSIWFR
jgi:thiosulfate dehydrogenase [quinone] large subunit